MNNMKEIKVYFDGITSTYGCYIQNACVTLYEDYTMNQLVSAIKSNGYQMFKLHSMKTFAKVY